MALNKIEKLRGLSCYISGFRFVKKIRIGLKKARRKLKEEPLSVKSFLRFLVGFSSSLSTFLIIIYSCILPLIVYYFVEEGVKFEGFGGVIAASIAGGFAFLTNLNSVESNIRNLREKWLENLRVDVAEYISSSRKLLKKAEEHGRNYNKLKRLESTISYLEEEGGDRRTRDVASKDKEDVESKVAQAYQEYNLLRDGFFNSYGKINIRVRGKSKGLERRLHKALHSHFRFYSKLILKAFNGKNVSSYDFSLKDTYLADYFTRYFKREWERIKSGELEIKLKKMVTGLVMVSAVVSYGIYHLKLSGEYDVYLDELVNAFSFW